MKIFALTNQCIMTVEICNIQNFCFGQIQLNLFTTQG